MNKRIRVAIPVVLVLALATWLTVGRAVWLFPLLLDENTGLDKAFKPVVEVSPAPTGSSSTGPAAATPSLSPRSPKPSSR